MNEREVNQAKDLLENFLVVDETTQNKLLNAVKSLAYRYFRSQAL